MKKRALVTGGSGFIGHHLCRYLKDKGYWVRAVDVQGPRFGAVDCDHHSWFCDLREFGKALWATQDVDEVYALAADMGGMGFIGSGEHDREIMHNNSLINLNTLEAARVNDVPRYLFTSSACVYPEYRQMEADSAPLGEEDAYPAYPDTPYGWEKLYTERLCLAYQEPSDMEIRIARFHNIFGPEGSYNDGREKLPAAACRKVAEAKLAGTHEVEVWGDGLAVRSFCYIEDCLEMLFRLMQSEFSLPLNIGTDRAVTVNEVFDIVADAAGVEIVKKHIPGPQGVRGRNADLSLMRTELGYEPTYSLEEGLAITYKWVEGQMLNG